MIDQELSFLKWKKVFFFISFHKKLPCRSLDAATAMAKFARCFVPSYNTNVEHKRQASKNHDVKDQSIEKNVCEKMKKEREGGRECTGPALHTCCYLL